MGSPYCDCAADAMPIPMKLVMMNPRGMAMS
jgi:hypothetical protein